MWFFCASVANTPGRRLLMVTLWRTVWRDRPATKPTRPSRALFESGISPCGDFTERELMLTMRPNLRSIMPSTTARIMAMGPSIIESMAAIHSSRST